MKVLQIVGGKKVGKTTVMLDFIASAKAQGLKVVAFKRAHEATLDTPATDSYRFSEAGADGVGLLTPAGFLWHEKRVAELAERLEEFVDAQTDLVLLEGFRAEKFPRLSLIKADSDQLAADFIGTIFPDQLSEYVSDLTTVEKRKEWLLAWLMN